MVFQPPQEHLGKLGEHKCDRNKNTIKHKTTKGPPGSQNPSNFPRGGHHIYLCLLPPPSSHFPSPWRQPKTRSKATVLIFSPAPPRADRSFTGGDNPPGPVPPSHTSHQGARPQRRIPGVGWNGMTPASPPARWPITMSHSLAPGLVSSIRFRLTLPAHCMLTELGIIKSSDVTDLVGGRTLMIK